MEIGRSGGWINRLTGSIVVVANISIEEITLWSDDLIWLL